MDTSVHVTISKAEALVLFEMLNRWSGEHAIALRDGADRAALCAVQAELERTLVEPFLKEYPRILEHAREELAAGRSAGREQHFSHH